MGGVSTPSEEAALRLQQLLGLSVEDATRAVAETVDCFRFEVDEYIAARHRELSELGLRNEALLPKIQHELRALRFRAPALSLRQIRRRVYG